MQAWVLVRTGKPATAFERQEKPDPQPGAGQVQIAVEAFGLNFADVMARRGLYRDAPPRPSILGYEVVGRVSKLGEQVSELTEGQRVVAFTRFGGYATKTVADARVCAPLPEDMDAATATALATQACTAHFAGEEMVRMRPGDHVLIHAAAGGVGHLLVQLAKHRGAVVFGTAGSPAKLDFLKKLGVDHPINYRTENFAEVVQQQLGEVRKLDVVFDSIGGRTFRQSRQLLGAGGRIVTYGMAERAGKTGGFFRTLLTLWRFGWPHPIMLLANCQAILGVNMLRLADYRPDLLQRSLRGVIELAEQGVVEPQLGEVFPADKLASAHELLESRTSMGKIAIKWPEH